MASETPHPAPTPVPGLVVRSVGDEAVVYHPATATTHALEPKAAAVLAALDGRRDLPAIAEAANRELGGRLEPSEAATVVASLSRAGLVLDDPSASGSLDGGDGLVARRTILAGGAAITVAVAGGGVWSVLAPSPAAALSRGGSTTTVTTDLSLPNGVAISGDGSTLYVADYGNNRIAAVDVATGTVTTLAGNGTSGFADGTGGAAGTAQFNQPEGVALSPDGATLYVSDSFNNRVRAINVATGAVTTVAGDGTAGFADGTGGASGTAQFSSPVGLAVSLDGSTLYVADANNNRIRAIALGTGSVTTVAGNGTAGWVDGTGGPSGTTQFRQPTGLALYPDGTTLYVVDSSNNRIRVFDVPTGLTNTLAGNGTAGFADGTGGPSGTASFRNPWGVAVSADGAVLYISDYENNRIRAVDVFDGTTTTLAGNGSSGLVDGTGGPSGTTEFSGPLGVAVSPDGSVLYVADSYNDAVRAVR